MLESEVASLLEFLSKSQVEVQRLKEQCLQATAGEQAQVLCGCNAPDCFKSVYVIYDITIGSSKLELCTKYSLSVCSCHRRTHTEWSSLSSVSSWMLSFSVECATKTLLFRTCDARIRQYAVCILHSMCSYKCACALVVYDENMPLWEGITIYRIHRTLVISVRAHGSSAMLGVRCGRWISQCRPNNTLIV